MVIVMSMINQKAILGSLPLLATVLGKKYGIKVIIEGDEACTNGSTIYLPALPNEANDTLLGLVRGWIDHEAAHIRATDFSVLQEAKPTPLVKHITNIFEDWRVENELVKFYPGSRKNFDWMIRYQFSAPPELNVPLKTKLVNYLLYTVRSWDQSIIEPQRNHLGKDLEASQLELMKAIKGILKRVYRNCNSTADCLAYALEIEKLIQSEAKVAQSNIKKKGKQKKLRLSSESNEFKKGLQEMAKIDSTAKDLPADNSSKVAKEIAKLSRNGSSRTPNRVQIAKTAPKVSYELSEADLKDCHRSSIALSSRLSSLLQAKKLCRSHLGRRGRIDHSSLYKIGRDPKLFRKYGEKQKLNTSVHILLDKSGSMKEHMRLASKACYSVTKSLDTLDGVNLQVTAFPVKSTQGYAVGQLLHYKQKLHHRFNMPASGGTPVAQSLWWVFQNDIHLSEDRKLIFLITDGEADNEIAAKQAISYGKKLGFEFHGIGLKSSAIQTLLPESSEVITSLKDLAPQIFKLLEKSLIKK